MVAQKQISDEKALHFVDSQKAYVTWLLKKYPHYCSNLSAMAHFCDENLLPGASDLGFPAGSLEYYFIVDGKA